MTTVKDSRYYDRLKFLGINSSSKNESEEQREEQQQITDLELEWIHGISDQVAFANMQVLTQFHLNLKIAKKWPSWNKGESRP
jgi:hypothetical protein